MTEIFENEIIEETEQPIEEIVEIPQRVNPFCVISKDTFGEYEVHDIQTNSAWGSNPYGDGYAVVPDEMVQTIMETRGFVDIELNEDETEVISFTAREIPEIPQEEPKPTLEERVTTLEENVKNSNSDNTWDEIAKAIESGVNEV